MSAVLPSNTATGGNRAITAAALMATYMEAVNISLPNAALPHIQGTLSMGNDEVGWVFTAYIVAGAAVMPMARWLAGRYGRKTIYQVSLAVFSLGLILDTLATTSLQFVFARIVQGAASGTLAPLSLAILLSCCRRRAMPGSVWRGRSASCSASAAARASAAGSVNITAGARSFISACR
jgi:MFS transporter, DHA2 family, multidrug resistance protein